MGHSVGKGLEVASSLVCPRSSGEAQVSQEWEIRRGIHRAVARLLDCKRVLCVLWGTERDFRDGLAAGCRHPGER